MAETTGMVVALILSNNDIGDKPGGAPAGMRFSVADRRDIVECQERYFDSHVVMHEATS